MDRQITFRASAVNEAGFSFAFSFLSYNWCNVQDTAEAALADIVLADTLHQANGPWRVTRIDVGYP